MSVEIISFIKGEKYDIVLLLGNELCTINYDCDFEIESTRKNIRKIIKLGIEGEFERKNIKVKK